MLVVSLLLGIQWFSLQERIEHLYSPCRVSSDYACALYVAIQSVVSDPVARQSCDPSLNEGVKQHSNRHDLADRDC